MTGIELWSTTAANNNSAVPNGWPEGMAPSGVNDAARQMMAATRTWYETAEWVDFGDTPTYIGATSFSVVGDLTTRYQIGRRIRAVGTTPFTIYGTISNSAFVSVTTVTVVWDSGSLNGTLSAVSVGSASVTNPSVGTSAIKGYVSIPYTAASASGPASLEFAEDTDNGANKVTLKAPASIASDADVILPASGTLYSTATDSITSAQLATSLTDETGSGAAVFATSPTLVTPVLGVASATSISFGNEVLNDYDEGSWTPAITAGGTPGTPAYSTQVGRYTKIGRLVHVSFALSLSGWTGSPSGIVNITGLPFTAANIANNFGGGSCFSYIVAGLAATNYGLQLAVTPNSTVMGVNSNSNTTVTQVTAAHTGTTPTLFGQAWYIV